MLAAEGINGSISGTREAVEIVMSAIQSDERLTNLLRTEAPAGVDDDKIHNGHSPKSPLGAGENSPARWDHVRVKLKKEVRPNITHLVVECRAFDFTSHENKLLFVSRQT